MHRHTVILYFHSQHVTPRVKNGNPEAEIGPVSITDDGDLADQHLVDRNEFDERFEFPLFTTMLRAAILPTVGVVDKRKTQLYSRQ
ncbi:unnamed protein product [Dibothriocephalus latus]|uniref:Uncharacterized protein n=1 Tax=Dibothriocephalus latus TaxID=60516 RepID=A0A3P7P546_DIBLA|nr:unnamed protein product [Dibothriocephalus latus]